jgi:glycosyltransferase involved in cell wall biosynthesis
MSRRLHIVSVCRTLPTPDDPSAGVFVLNRLAAMAAHADLSVVQPVPFTPGLRPLPDWARAASREAQGLKILHAPMFYLPGILKGADAVWLARAIAPLLRKLHAQRPLDLVDAHFGYPDGAGCRRVAERLGVPVFITIRGFENEYVAIRGVGAQMTAAMRAADGCISVSHSLRELALHHGVEAGRLRVIHNAVEWERFAYGERAAARRALGLDLAEPLLVSVGHLVVRKRHHVLLEAFAELLRRRPQARLVIIGGDANEPGYRERLLREIADRGLAGRASLAGNLPPAQVADWLRAADLFALGTAREGCCNAVLEALAVGVPVVTTPVGDNAEFVRPGENGAIVPVDDATAFAAALDAGLARDWDRPAIARRLREQVGSWDVVGQRCLEFMQERLAA